jgi:hypothetical protein
VIWEDVVAAAEDGTFENRPDRYLTRSPLELDERGWGEMNDALGDLLEKVDRIADRSADRIAKSGEEAIPTRLVLMHFESPSQD